MNSAVLLYTMKCNISCEHCSVDSHPHRTEKMLLEEALQLAEGLCQIKELKFIDVSGGEPMLHPAEMAELARLVRKHGKEMRIVSNGFWAATRQRAEESLQEMRRNGVASIGISIDEWHLPFLPADRIHNYVAACRHVGMTPFLSCVVASQLADNHQFRIPEVVCEILRKYEISEAECIGMNHWIHLRQNLGNVSLADFDREFGKRYILINWQSLNGEGRGRGLLNISSSLDTTKEEPCDIAGELPTFDEAGRLFPCCSPWVSRKDHAIARVVGGTVENDIASMKTHPLIRVIHKYGPKRMIDALRLRGHDMPSHHSGICNQCGIIMDRVPMEDLQSVAAEVIEEAELDESLRILGLNRKSTGRP